MKTKEMITGNGKSLIFKEIKKSLDALSDPGYLKQLSRIEMDLVMEKLRTMYDLLSGMEDTDSGERPGANVEAKFEVDENEEINPSIVEEKIQQSETEPGEIALEELVFEKREPVEDPPRSSDKPLQPDLFTTGDAARMPEKKSVIDAISRENQTESIADKFQKNARVESLKKAIGINEKFFFINELFEGDLNEYNSVIESLDQFKTLEDSLSYLHNLSEERNWNDHAEAFSNLKQFLERKLK